MRKKKYFSIFAFFVLSIFLVACSSGESSGDGNGQSAGGADGQSGTDFPTKNITIVVHTSSGGPTDLMARELARAAEEVLGTNVVVENRPGGSGATAMAQVFSADPDGYTLGAMTPSQIGLINGTLKEQYDINDFTWLSRAQIDPYVLVVNSESPFNTLEDLVEYLEENPNGLTVGGYGAEGSGHNVAWNIFAEAAGVDANWTPFESTGDAVTGILGKHIDVANSNPGQVMQYVEAGQLRVLGVMADERLEDLPDVPTYEEAGITVDTGWAQFRGVFGPKDMPQDVIDILSDAFMEAYSSESYTNYMRNSQLVESPMGYEEYTEYIMNQNELTGTWYERLGVN
ncbi:tripartite tricarboxylate transporter substrate binding protein [Halalkalibacter alkaliphilus]|uniref:Tripartite tricarboxylate transporter substrate binding protein n=1 Tax=Halalkalibacter alkaliphilus TaxID=2917993 RepID=A0A9X2I6J4_9BACI|nr:tripartite tricarboxylate transporter substrate binding protein [Halalkalibacter alkaliphilus]MCL7749226.1 tripartite tricarboxylate transporter substrate binding protein [Halalkalibacter alkaliphilus]